MHAFTVKIQSAEGTTERTVYARGTVEAAKLGQQFGLVVGVRRMFSVVDMGASWVIHGPGGAMVSVRYDGSHIYSNVASDTPLYARMLEQVAGRVSSEPFGC